MLKLKKRHLCIIAIAFTFSSLNLSLPANAIMDGQIVQTSSRVVPIFILPNESDPQPTSTVAFTGFLYSSRIVFTAIPEIGFDGNGNRTTRNPAAIYVGKPGSDISDTTGRVKVLKSFYSKQFRFEDGKLDEFGILVLEKDLVTANPFTLLTESMQRELAKTVKITGYGEYRDQCPPGGQPPCREKLFEPSSKPRAVTVNQVSISEIESLVGYKQPQLRNQMIFYNRANPRAGAVCFGDSGAPIIGEYRFKDVYLGQMSSAVRIYGCGRGEGYDGKGGIHYASPVYKHVELIRAAEAFVQAQKKITVKTEGDASSALFIGSTSVLLKTTKSAEHENEKVEVVYEGDLSDPSSNPAGFRFFNGYGGDLIQVSQILMSNAKCSKLSATKLKCAFPSFNPYKNILIKKSGVALHAAPYNKAGQGPLSPSVTMHELLFKSAFKSIDFVDNAKVIDDIFGSSLKNVGGFRSTSATSQLRATFILDGPPPSNAFVNPKFTLNEISSTKSIWHQLQIDEYKYQSGKHRFSLISRDKLKFAGDTNFYVEMQISDRDGFVRARETTSFTFGYKMDPLCSITLLTHMSVRDRSKLDLKTIIAINDAVQLVLDKTAVPGSTAPPSIARKFFKYGDLISFTAETGLIAIEAAEKGDWVEFRFKFTKQVGDLALEKGIEATLKRRMSPDGLTVLETYYVFSETAKNLADFIVNYAEQVDVWAKKNGEMIVDLCGKT